MLLCLTLRVPFYFVAATTIFHFDSPYLFRSLSPWHGKPVLKLDRLPSPQGTKQTAQARPSFFDHPVWNCKWWTFPEPSVFTYLQHWGIVHVAGTSGDWKCRRGLFINHCVHFFIFVFVLSFVRLSSFVFFLLFLFVPMRSTSLYLVTVTTFISVVLPALTWV